VYRLADEQCSGGVRRGGFQLDEYSFGIIPPLRTPPALTSSSNAIDISPLRGGSLSTTRNGGKGRLGVSIH
jgi:hypothetical protein